MRLANSSQIRRADQIMIEEMDFPGVLLMETAGRKSAEFILAQYPDREIVILTGPGNNGGDGLVIARYLSLAGKKVQVWLSRNPDEYQGDARINFFALLGSDVEVDEWNQQNLPPEALLIDALLGTGISASLRGTIAEMVAQYASHPGPVIAIDLPSGLDANTGHVLNAVIPAEQTLTFQVPKICHAVTPAATHCGQTHVLDIGIWPSVMEQLGIQRTWLHPVWCQQHLKSRPLASHKGSFGHALLIGGSSRYAGAIALAGHAALHCGAGLASILGSPESRQASLALGPEVIVQCHSEGMLQPEDVELALEFARGKTIGIGPGMEQEPAVLGFLEAFLAAQDKPLVLDADALNLLAGHPALMDSIPPNSILTPHPGEMKRLTGRDDVNDFRLEITEELAQLTGCIVVLKGAGTVIAAPDGHTWVNPTGNPGMATGGSGDVLTGILTSLLAQGYAPAVAAALGVFLHGRAGDIAARQFGQAGVTAGRILQALGPAVQSVLLEQTTNSN